ncbi:hypothetical protein [Thiothrix lacustris]|uniref:hypothetical protein n=1 Tax=Thiothrix lacustris TaxID=525917 RepID=UPI000490384D|nr:hypothetical protein [Thiothrix lacustris]
MPKASRKKAVIQVLTALVQRPHKTSELDAVLGWRNSPQAVLDLRHRGFEILTTYDTDRRGIYSIPHTEKPKIYKFLGEHHASFKH